MKHPYLFTLAEMPFGSHWCTSNVYVILSVDVYLRKKVSLLENFEKALFTLCRV